MYAAALEKLHADVTGGSADAAPMLRANPRLSPEKQIAIYAEGYKIRLSHAVRDDYPCLGHYLGDDLPPLIDAYIAATPSQSYSLDFYPHAFWRFARAKLSDPAMREVAELEGAIAEIFMGPGSPALTPQHLPSLNEETLAQTKFNLRAPHRFLSFTHDAESTLAGFKRGEAPQPIETKPTYLFLHRHNNEVHRRLLDEGEYRLLQAIDKSANFAEAVQQSGIGEETLAATIGRWLSRWIGDGFFTP